MTDTMSAFAFPGMTFEVVREWETGAPSQPVHVAACVEEDPAGGARAFLAVRSPGWFDVTTLDPAEWPLVEVAVPRESWPSCVYAGAKWEGRHRASESLEAAMCDALDTLAAELSNLD